jgi:tRNA-splicing ligase RtcB (3'-phosphate/5'-hydroxy nucleic acid ligase)
VISSVVGSCSFGTTPAFPPVIMNAITNAKRPVPTLAELPTENADGVGPVTRDVPGGVPVKSWTRGVMFEAEAEAQIRRVAMMPFVHKWVAVMPDVHAGLGATVGSVVASKGAIIPAAVGVDIGCGMMAVKTSLNASQLPEQLFAVRSAIEAAVPHGRTDDGGRNDRGAWNDIPDAVRAAWAELEPGYKLITEKHRALDRGKSSGHLGTLGTGNHFIEICLDESNAVWIMLHSGSRGVGNRIGMHFIELAQKEMRRWMINLPDQDLAYLPEGSDHFWEYWKAVSWAQKFAAKNRELMMDQVVAALRTSCELPAFELSEVAVNCHHNYVAREHHYGENVMVTRKGAVSASEGKLGIIPGSMGAKSFIVRGKGNPESFHSCSHGAGRTMSRTKAKKLFTVEDHVKATAGVECRKDESVIDETPAAYKSIDAVMHAQRDLVDVVHTLKQVVCVKG